MFRSKKLLHYFLYSVMKVVWGIVKEVGFVMLILIVFIREWPIFTGIRGRVDQFSGQQKRSWSRRKNRTEKSWPRKSFARPQIRINVSHSLIISNHIVGPISVYGFGNCSSWNLGVQILKVHWCPWIKWLSWCVLIDFFFVEEIIKDEGKVTSQISVRDLGFMGFTWD